MQALAMAQQDLEGKKEELQQEVVRSTKYKNVHLKIQDAISEVSDCMTPAGSSRCSFFSICIQTCALEVTYNNNIIMVICMLFGCL